MAKSTKKKTKQKPDGGFVLPTLCLNAEEAVAIRLALGDPLTREVIRLAVDPLVRQDIRHLMRAGLVEMVRAESASMHVSVDRLRQEQVDQLEKLTRAEEQVAQLQRLVVGTFVALLGTLAALALAS